MVIVSNGEAVNTDPQHLNEIVEFTRPGTFVGQFQLDNGPGGAAFGIAIAPDRHGKLRFFAVDDNTNSLDIFTFGN